MLEAKIYLNSNDNGTIDYNSSSFNLLNNISNISNLKNIKPKVQKPFILGVSKFSDDTNFVENYNGIITREYVDDNGNCDYTMVLKGNSIKYLYLIFNASTDEFASLLNVNGVDYENDNVTMILEFDSVNEININIKKWSKPNSYITFNSITTGVSSIDLIHNILSYNFENKIVNDNTKPEFGFFTSVGKITFIDTDDILKSSLEKKLLNNSKIEIKFNGRLIETCYANKWEVDYENNQYMVETKKINENILNLELPRKNVGTVELNETISVYELLSEISTNYINVNFSTISPQLTDKLTNKKINNFYRGKTTIQSMLNYICVSGMVCAYIDNEGKIGVVEYV